VSLDALQDKSGVVFNEGDDVVQHYGNVAEEYQAAKTSVGLIDVSNRGKLRLTGGDRTRFLHGMVTNTVTGLAEMTCNHASLTTVQGQTLLDVWVHHLGDHLWLETETGFQTKLFESLDKYLIADDVTMADETDQWAILGVVGPQAIGVVETVLNVNVQDLAENQTYQGQWQGTEFWATRRSFWGVGGLDVRVQGDKKEPLWESLIAAGAKPVGKQALEILRVEAGVPRCGIEIDESVAPLETGLEDAVDFNKGCYIGQEVIAKMHFRGKPRRYLVGLKIDGDEVIAPSSDLYTDEKRVGKLTSCVRSISCDAVIGLGIVRRGFHEVGQVLDLAETKVTVVALPFVE